MVVPAPGDLFFDLLALGTLVVGGCSLLVAVLALREQIRRDRRMRRKRRRK